MSRSTKTAESNAQTATTALSLEDQASQGKAPDERRRLRLHAARAFATGLVTAVVVLVAVPLFVVLDSNQLTILPREVWAVALLATILLLITSMVYLSYLHATGIELELQPVPRDPGVPLTMPDRLELLRLESGLLQSRFDKYDQMVFQLRGWLVTILVALFGAFFTLGNRSRPLLFVAVGSVVVFWWIESRWRHQWLKYVQRYKHLRSVLHEGTALTTLSPLDLTDHYRRKHNLEAYQEEYGERIGAWIARAHRGDEAYLPSKTVVEMTVFYFGLFLAAIYLGSL